MLMCSKVGNNIKRSFCLKYFKEYFIAKVYWVGFKILWQKNIAPAAAIPYQFSKSVLINVSNNQFGWLISKQCFDKGRTNSARTSNNQHSLIFNLCLYCLMILLQVLSKQALASAGDFCTNELFYRKKVVHYA